MSDLRHGWKILTHDGRSPLQGGPRLLKERFPVTLPPVTLDTGPDECAAGWNYVADIAAGWRIVGMWPTGYPSRVIAVEASADAIEREGKRRASSLTLVREATETEMRDAMTQGSCLFGEHADTMAREQLAWWHALGRRERDPKEVEAQLVLTLSARQLPWTLRRFDDARDAKAARGPWDPWNVRDAKAAWDARDPWNVRDARAAWAAWDAWDVGNARAAWAAWDALTIFYARLKGWQDGEPDQYTVGIRDAYRQGLALALPVAPTILGWAMEPELHAPEA